MQPPAWDQTATFLSHFVVFLLWLHKRSCGVARDWSRVVLATGPPLSASARTCQISSLSPARSGHLQVPAAKPDLRQDASSYPHRSYPAAHSCAVGREDFPAFLTCGVCDLSQCLTGLFVSKTSSQVYPGVKLFYSRSDYFLLLLLFCKDLCCKGPSTF